MRIDCSKTLNFATERKRMCEDYFHRICYKGDEECPLHKIHTNEWGFPFNCKSIDCITQELIDDMQKWSDEHPKETLVDRFYKIFPNALRNPQNLQPMACPYQLGWYEEDGCPEMSCEDCWNRPYIEKKD